MNGVATSMALAVKELEIGEFHWILLREEASSSEDQLAYSPLKMSRAYADGKAAWAAGYLALRAGLNRSYGRT